MAGGAEGGADAPFFSPFSGTSFASTLDSPPKGISTVVT